MKKFKLSILLFILILNFTACSSLELQNENGIALEFSGKDGISKPQETENYKILFVGITTEKGGWRWGYSFNIKNEDIQVEYVKVEMIMPNKSIVMIEDTESIKHNKNDFEWIKNKTTTSYSKTSKLIINKKPTYTWSGQTSLQEVSDDMLKSIKRSKYLYLAKFTIKGIEKKPEVIYQPLILPLDLGLVHTVM